MNREQRPVGKHGGDPIRQLAFNNTHVISVWISDNAKRLICVMVLEMLVNLFAQLQ